MIFVTGGTGLIGKHLVKRLLSEGKNIRVLIRDNADKNEFSSEEQSKIDFVEGDVLDVALMYSYTKDVDEILHTAAIVSFDSEDKNPMYVTNIEGTINLVNAALHNSVKRFFHISSVAALGRSEGIVKLDEDTKWVDSKLNSSYGITKYHAELEVWRGVEEGLNAIVLNPSVVLGLGDWEKTSSRIVKQIFKDGKNLIDGTFNYVDIRDLGEIFIRLHRSEIVNERFIVNAKQITQVELYKNFNKALKRDIKIRPISKTVLKSVYYLDKVISFLLRKRVKVSRELLDSFTHNIVYKNSKSKEFLNFEYTPFEDTVTWLSASYVEKYGLDPR